MKWVLGACGLAWAWCVWMADGPFIAGCIAGAVVTLFFLEPEDEA